MSHPGRSAGKTPAGSFSTRHLGRADTRRAVAVLIKNLEEIAQAARAGTTASNQPLATSSGSMVCHSSVSLRT